ncbi:hypothetical protein F4861DRAFT_544342 [Xylaria intraflava]|nr:hypothetical protein F4861DRAFT_544342 [Xylaria intraflava]
MIEPAVAQAVTKIDDKINNLVQESGLQETLDAHGRQLATGADRTISQNAVNKALYNFTKEIQKTVKWDVEKLSEIIPIVRKIERYFHKLRDRLRENDVDILGERPDLARDRQANVQERRTQPATTATTTFGQPSQPTSIFGPFGQQNLGGGTGRAGMDRPGNLFLQTQSTSRGPEEKIPWKVNTTGARGPQKKFVELAPIEISDDPPSSDYDYYSDDDDEAGPCDGRQPWKEAPTTEQEPMAPATGQGTAATGEDQAAEAGGTGEEKKDQEDRTPRKMEMNLW